MDQLPEGAGPADHYGRLAPGPEVFLAIAQAAERAWAHPVPSRRPDPASSWRFSGRWFSASPTQRRERPVR